MSRETWEERKAREAKRDALRDVAWGTAQHIAGGNIQRVERVERNGYPAFQFSSFVAPVRCECGMPMTPVPYRTDAFDGFCPHWMCPICHLPEVIKGYARVERLIPDVQKPDTRMANFGGGRDAD